jgi:hypothetical protein
VLIGFSLVHPQPSPSAMARRQSSGIAAGWLDGEAQRNLAPAPVHMSAEHVEGFFTTCRVVVLGLLGRLLFKSRDNSLYDTRRWHNSFYDTEKIFLPYMTRSLTFMPYMTFPSILASNCVNCHMKRRFCPS